MSGATNDFSKFGFAKTFVIPALLIFLLPAISLAFFWHAQSSYDREYREGVLEQIKADTTLTADERREQIDFYTQVPMSRLIKEPEIARQMEQRVVFDYATFRWAIRLSLASIVCGVLVLILAGVCVLLSRRSQQAQYLSLSAGWQVLRVYGALQTIVQGVLVVALSYWVTALWMNVYVPKLILIVGALALFAMAAVIKAIFTQPDLTKEVEGVVVDRQANPRLWHELDRICAKVGTRPPDQVIAGINDLFFVTEVPVTVAGRRYFGRSLFVSLSLLKQMDGAEADAVLAHEMAHFSGNDTLYTKKIAPLRMRFAAYLEALHEQVVALPVFYFMHCFWALFELSLAEHSREREFRADQVAAQSTSPSAFASALLRIVAYADFRGNVQGELFKHERSLASANILSTIESGFHAHTLAFAGKPDIGSLETVHPFDTHPPLTQRFDAVGVPLRPGEVQSLVARPGDGRWYATIDNAEQLERAQWSEFEEHFRVAHEQSLAYRFLPETDEERAIVTAAFPEITIEGKQVSLILTCDTLRYTAWQGYLLLGEISSMAVNNDTLKIQYDREGKRQTATVPMKTFGTQQQPALDALNHYYSRYLNAVAYQQQKAASAAEPPKPAE